jgi:membrane-bound serine protease (ClpP class)
MYIELNRPGRIIPGALGLLAALLALPSLFTPPPTLVAALLLAAAIAIFAVGLRRTIHPMLYVVATIALTFGFHAIRPIQWKTAVICGLILGAGTSVLTRIAHRARVNKGLD